MNDLKQLSLAFSVSAETYFVEQQSDPSANRFVFSYTIRIDNNSNVPCQLLSRHWLIQDANRKVEEVYGEGMIGEQPLIQPKQSYQYSSGAMLETDIGTMEGRYFMICRSNEVGQQEFEISIPKFILSVPRTLH